MLAKNVQRIEQQKQTLQNQSNQIRAQVQDDEQAQLEQDRKSTRLNSSHITRSRMPSSA